MTEGLIDVAIVGAGAAGLGAARTLIDAGRTIVVLEAMARSGGRAWTDTTTFGVPVDWGCHWLHSGSINPMRELADELGIAYLDQPVPWRIVRDGHVASEEESDEIDESVDALYDQVFEAGADGIDVPYADIVDSAAPGYPLFQTSVRAEWGFDPSEVSTLDGSRYRDTDENWPVIGGYGALVQRAAAGVPVSRSTQVRRIELRPDRVRLDTTQGTIEARTVIVTVSTNVLASELIAFDPILPDWKLAAASAVPCGSNNKIVLAIDSRHLGIDEHSSIAIPYPGAPWLYVQVRPFGRNIVSIYLGGPLSKELEAAGSAAAVEAGIEALEGAFGTSVGAHVTNGAASAWGAEPFILGAYGAARPGLADLRSDLAVPVEDRIFFAGEATHPEFFSTCHGAWMSGIRAATEAMAVLQE